MLKCKRNENKGKSYEETRNVWILSIKLRIKTLCLPVNILYLKLLITT